MEKYLKLIKKWKILIFDIERGTFDLSILRFKVINIKLFFHGISDLRDQLWLDYIRG